MDGITKMSPIQLGVIGFFLAAIIVGMIVLATGRFGQGERTVSLTVWGTMSRAHFTEFTDAIGFGKAGSRFRTTYVEKDPMTYDTELVEALASGTGPDIFFLAHEDILKHKNKITPIPYDAYPLREYTDTFVKEAELFAFEDGLYAVPFTVDPMVMYWNTTLFSNAGIPRPPQYWDEFYSVVPQLTVKDADLNISQSAFALGEYDNITYAEEIISTLLLQNNVPISRLGSGDRVKAQLAKDVESESPLTTNSVVNFYTQFANSANDFYTWNRSLPNSQDYFVQTDLAMYFGFASERRELREKNPNLVFDVASFPQTRGGFERVTFGRLTGFAIPQNVSSTKKQDAYEAIRIMTSQDSQKTLAGIVELPPVRVDAFEQTPSDVFMPVYQEMALWSRGWLEPNPRETDDIFQTLINNVTSGRRSIGQSVLFATQQLNQAFGEVN